MFPRFLKYLLFFLSLLLLIQLFTTPEQKQEEGIKQEVQLTLEQSSFTIGETVNLSIENNSQESLAISQEDCLQNPLSVYKYQGGTWEKIKATSKTESCLEKKDIAPTETLAISYAPWNHNLFGQVGKYKIEYPYQKGEVQKEFFVEFEVSEPSFFKSMWLTFFYKPTYNSLVFFTKNLPEASNLGFAIILLTLLIKLILVVPNTRAIRSQQEMQKIQPMLAKIKSKHAGDQQKIAEETMKIWKEHKVNPFGSCLPLFIQLPIMLALFYVVQDGLQLEQNKHLLYAFLENANFIIDPMFLGALDLTIPNFYVLPFIVGGLQYLQMNMALPKVEKKKKDKGGMPDQAQMMNSTMKHVLPIMIAVFTASLPAAVGLFWGTSTLFAIVQQWFIMNMKKA